MDDKLLDKGVYKAWIDANPDKKGSEEYKAVESAFLAAGGLSPEIEAVKEVMLDPKTSSVERLAAIAPWAYYKGRDLVTSIGARAAPAALGQFLGQRYAGPIGGRVGAGVGSLAGSVYDQMRTKGEVSLGETVADVGSAVAAPRGMLKAGMVGAGASIAQQAIDEGKVDLGRAAQAASVATATAAGIKRAMPPKQEIPTRDSDYAYRYAAFRNVKPYGVKINPAEIERGSPAFSQFAGEDAMSVMAAKQNQHAWQKMVREQAGLETDIKRLRKNSLALAPATKKHGIDLDDSEIDRKIYDEAAPYRKIEEISKKVEEEVGLIAQQKLKNGKYVTSYVSPEGIDAMRGAAQNLKELRSVRKQQKVELAKMDAGDPMARDRFIALKEAESGLESKIEAAAVASGEKGLLDELKSARQKIAVLKTIDNATESYGLVNPKKLFQQREAGVPLSGNLEKIALFYDAFKQSGEEAVAAGMMKMPGTAANYTARNVAQAKASGLLSGGFPILSEAARNYIMRDAAQQRYAFPRIISAPATIQEMAARQASMAAAGRVGDASESRRSKK